MTFKAKLLMEFPDKVNEGYDGGCFGCPDNYGYRESYDCDFDCERCWNMEIPEKPVPMTAEEAWELSKKLFADFSDTELNEIFGKGWSYPKLMELSPYEARAKIDGWESQRIHVGDVCKAFETSCVVTQVDENKKLHVVLLDDGSTDQIPFDSPLKLLKTGKNIDIQSVLEQISKE